MYVSNIFIYPVFSALYPIMQPFLRFKCQLCIWFIATPKKMPKTISRMLLMMFSP